MKFTCSYCYKKFTDMKNSRRKYCSFRCYNKTRPKIFRNCEWCNKIFLSRGVGYSQTGRTRFCSKSCMAYWHNGKRSKIWKGGRFVHESGYVKVWLSPGKYGLEHRIVMEKHLNHKLTRKDAVHHLNGNKSDNRIKNLVVMSRSAHQAFHMKERKKQIWN